MDNFIKVSELQEMLNNLPSSEGAVGHTINLTMQDGTKLFFNCFACSDGSVWSPDCIWSHEWYVMIDQSEQT